MLELYSLELFSEGFLGSDVMTPECFVILKVWLFGPVFRICSTATAKNIACFKARICTELERRSGSVH